MKQKSTNYYITSCRSTGGQQGERPALFFSMAARNRSGDTPLTADNVCMKITNLLCIRYNNSILMLNQYIYILYIHTYTYTYIHIHTQTYIYIHINI